MIFVLLCKFDVHILNLKLSSNLHIALYLIHLSESENSTSFVHAIGWA